MGAWGLETRGTGRKLPWGRTRGLLAGFTGSWSGVLVGELERRGLLEALCHLACRNEVVCVQFSPLEMPRCI